MRNYKITTNPDTEHVKQIRDGLKANDGYCPCAIMKSPETKCMCQEFRDQLNDPEFDGMCHCGLYVKTKIEQGG